MKNWFALVLAGAFVQAACASPDPQSAEDDLTSCSGAKLDSKGTCRSKKGVYAKASCCAVTAPASRQNLDTYTCSASSTPIKVAFFDADSTLRVSKSGSVTANSVEDVNVLPFAASKIAELSHSGMLVAIVSNQGGVASGKQTFEVAEGALVFAAKQLAKLGGKIDYIDLAEKLDDNRKPETGMAKQLDALLQEKCGVGIDIPGSQMVGDSGYKTGVDGPHPDGRPADDFSNADRLFAENLGVPFQEPTDYFGWKAYEVYNIASQAELVSLLGKIDAEIATLRSSGEDPARLAALEAEVAGNRKVNALPASP